MCQQSKVWLSRLLCTQFNTVPGYNKTILHVKGSWGVEKGVTRVLKILAQKGLHLTGRQGAAKMAEKLANFPKCDRDSARFYTVQEAIAAACLSRGDQCYQSGRPPLFVRQGQTCGTSTNLPWCVAWLQRPIGNNVPTPWWYVHTVISQNAFLFAQMVLLELSAISSRSTVLHLWHERLFVFPMHIFHYRKSMRMNAH